MPLFFLCLVVVKHALGEFLRVEEEGPQAIHPWLLSDFIQRKVSLLVASCQEAVCALREWGAHPPPETEVGPVPPPVFTFHGDGPQVLKKDILGPVIGKRVFKRFATQRGRERIYVSLRKCPKNREAGGPGSGRSLPGVQASRGARQARPGQSVPQPLL